MSSTLVTGANGFLGNYICSKLVEQAKDFIAVSAKDGDLCQPGTYYQWNDTGVQTVIHLAARTFIPDSWNDPSGFIDNNVASTIHVLDFCRKNKAGIVLISGVVYDPLNELPYKESGNRKGINPYIMSKILCEDIAAFYNRQFEVPVTVIRPFNIYGYGQNPNFLIPSIIRQAISGNEIKVNCLTPMRDYVYVEDVADMCVVATGKMKGFQTYNVGSGYSLSVLDVIKAVEKAAGKPLTILSADLNRKNDQDNVIADISMAKAQLGWEPAIDFNNGISKLYRQYVQNP